MLLSKIKKIPKNTNGRLAIPALAGLLVSLFYDVTFSFAVLEYNHIDMKMQPIAANRPGFVHRYQSMYVMDDFVSFLLYY